MKKEEVRKKWKRRKAIEQKRMMTRKKRRKWKRGMSLVESKRQLMLHARLFSYLGGINAATSVPHYNIFLYSHHNINVFV